MAFAGLQAVWKGVKDWLTREEWDFTLDNVKCRCRTLRGWTEWSEPLSQYEGVIASQSLEPIGKHKRMVYYLALTHRSDVARSVVLYCSLSDKDLRARHERYARLFGLPALVMTADGVEKREVEELDLSVRERVERGALAVGFDVAAGPPGKGLAVRVAGDSLVLSVWGPMRRRYRYLPAILIVGGALVGSCGSMQEGRLSPSLAVGAAALFLAGVATLFLPSPLWEELCLSPDEARKCWRHPWGSFGERCLKGEGIEEVLVQAPPKGGRGTVVRLAGDESAIEFGAGLTPVQQQWVRDCTIAVLSRSRGVGGVSPPASPAP